MVFYQACIDKRLLTIYTKKSERITREIDMYNNKPFNPFQNNPFQNHSSAQQQRLHEQNNEIEKLRKENELRSQALQNMMYANNLSGQLSLLIRNKMQTLGLSENDLAAMTGLTNYDIVSVTLNSSSTSFENILRILSALKLNLQVY